MVSGVTYQLRGWLATLMVNKRRRRNILAAFTLGLILLCQTPNLINITFARSRRAQARSTDRSYGR